MKVIPFRPEHIGLMNLQEHQRLVISSLTMPYLSQIISAGPTLSAVVDDRVIACAGIASPGLGIGTLWAVVAKDAGPYFIRLDRCVRRFLEIPKLRRIEASSEVDFAPGCRWLELLGFQSEGIMRKYGPNGEDHMRYARVT